MIIQVTLLETCLLEKVNYIYYHYNYKCKISHVRKKTGILLIIQRGSHIILMLANLIRGLSHKGNGKEICWSEIIAMQK